MTSDPRKQRHLFSHNTSDLSRRDTNKSNEASSDTSRLPAAAGNGLTEQVRTAPPAAPSPPQRTSTPNPVSFSLVKSASIQNTNDSVHQPQINPIGATSLPIEALRQPSPVTVAADSKNHDFPHVMPQSSIPQSDVQGLGTMLSNLISVATNVSRAEDEQGKLEEQLSQLRKEELEFATNFPEHKVVIEDLRRRRKATEEALESSRKTLNQDRPQREDACKALANVLLRAVQAPSVKAPSPSRKDVQPKMNPVVSRQNERRASPNLDSTETRLRRLEEDSKTDFGRIKEALNRAGQVSQFHSLLAKANISADEAKAAANTIKSQADKAHERANEAVAEATKLGTDAHEVRKALAVVEKKTRNLDQANIDNEEVRKSLTALEAKATEQESLILATKSNLESTTSRFAAFATTYDGQQSVAKIAEGLAKLESDYVSKETFKIGFEQFTTLKQTIEERFKALETRPSPDHIDHEGSATRTSIEPILDRLSKLEEIVEEERKIAESRQSVAQIRLSDNTQLQSDLKAQVGKLQLQANASTHATTNIIPQVSKMVEDFKRTVPARDGGANNHLIVTEMKERQAELAAYRKTQGATDAAKISKTEVMALLDEVVEASKQRHEKLVDDVKNEKTLLKYQLHELQAITQKQTPVLKELKASVASAEERIVQCQERIAGFEAQDSPKPAEDTTPSAVKQLMSKSLLKRSSAEKIIASRSSSKQSSSTSSRNATPTEQHKKPDPNIVKGTLLRQESTGGASKRAKDSPKSTIEQTPSNKKGSGARTFLMLDGATSTPTPEVVPTPSTDESDDDLIPRLARQAKPNTTRLVGEPEDESSTPPSAQRPRLDENYLEQWTKPIRKRKVIDSSDPIVADGDTIEVDQSQSPPDLTQNEPLPDIPAKRRMSSGDEEYVRPKPKKKKQASLKH